LSNVLGIKPEDQDLKKADVWAVGVFLNWLVFIRFILYSLMAIRSMNDPEWDYYSKKSIIQKNKLTRMHWVTWWLPDPNPLTSKLPRCNFWNSILII
jgi:hypothetical protein